MLNKKAKSGLYWLESSMKEEASIQLKTNTTLLSKKR